MSDDVRAVVDARGLRCPLPVIRLAQRVVDLQPGARVEVWATDPAAAADIPAWCRMRGQDYLGHEERGHAERAHGERGREEREPDEGGAFTAYLVRVVAAG